MEDTPIEALCRRTDPETSRAAASSIKPSILEGMVLEAIASFGKRGCISDEVRRLFPDLAYSSVTARYKALKDKGLIEIVALRPGDSGRLQSVMVARNGAVKP
jgi:hypothetical protein